MSETITLTAEVSRYLEDMEKSVDNLRNYTERLATNGRAKPKTVKSYQKILRRRERQLAQIRADPAVSYELWREGQIQRNEALRLQRVECQRHRRAVEAEANAKKKAESEARKKAEEEAYAAWLENQVKLAWEIQVRKGIDVPKACQKHVWGHWCYPCEEQCETCEHAPAAILAEAGVIAADVERCHKKYFGDSTCSTVWGGNDQHAWDCPQPAAICYVCRLRWEAHQ